jgi:peroxiredoxin
LKTSNDPARRPGQSPSKGSNAGGPVKRPQASAQQMRPGARTTAPAAKPGTRTGTPTVRPGQRPGPSRRAPAKKGFQPRPLDFIIGGVVLLVVGFVIWSGLNATIGGNKTSSTSSAGAPLGATGQSTGRTDPNNVPNITPIPSGNKAWDFSLPATDGKTYTLSQYAGKPLLIEFMAPWCPHCQNDAPIFEQVYQKYHDKGLEMIGISASPYGRNYENNDQSPITMADLVWFKNTFKVAYPMLLDTKVAVADNYGIAYFPTLYLLDKDQKVVEVLLAEDNKALDLPRISTAVEKVLD